MTAEGWAVYENMPMAANPSWGAQESDQRVARGNPARVRAGMPRRAAVIEFARCNSSEPQPRTFTTPNRAVTVPDMGRRTCEIPSLRDDGDVSIGHRCDKAGYQEDEKRTGNTQWQRALHCLARPASTATASL